MVGRRDQFSWEVEGAVEAGNLCEDLGLVGKSVSRARRLDVAGRRREKEKARWSSITTVWLSEDASKKREERIVEEVFLAVLVS